MVLDPELNATGGLASARLGLLILENILFSVFAVSLLQTINSKRCHSEKLPHLEFAYLFSGPSGQSYELNQKRISKAECPLVVRALQRTST